VQLLVMRVECLCATLSLFFTNDVSVTYFDHIRLLSGKVKAKLSLYRPWRLLGLPEVEAPTISDIRQTDGGKVVSPTRRPLFTPRKIPGAYFY
jgi:hypothetical protein